MFAYCGNNPVIREDTEGEAFDTAWDVVSVGMDIAEVIANPSNIFAWGALAAVIARLVLPGVTGGGQIVRFAAKVDALVDAAKYADEEQGLHTGTNDRKRWDKQKQITYFNLYNGRKVIAPTWPNGNYLGLAEMPVGSRVELDSSLSDGLQKSVRKAWCAASSA